jgi:hypothetical protein
MMASDLAIEERVVTIDLKAAISLSRQELLTMKSTRDQGLEAIRKPNSD